MTPTLRKIESYVALLRGDKEVFVPSNLVAAFDEYIENLPEVILKIDTNNGKYYSLA